MRALPSTILLCACLSATASASASADPPSSAAAAPVERATTAPRPPILKIPVRAAVDLDAQRQATELAQRQIADFSGSSNVLIFGTTTAIVLMIVLLVILL